MNIKIYKKIFRNILFIVAMLLMIIDITNINNSIFITATAIFPSIGLSMMSDNMFNKIVWGFDGVLYIIEFVIRAFVLIK